MSVPRKKIIANSKKVHREILDAEKGALRLQREIEDQVSREEHVKLEARLVAARRAITTADQQGERLEADAAQARQRSRERFAWEATAVEDLATAQAAHARLLAARAKADGVQALFMHLPRITPIICVVGFCRPKRAPSSASSEAALPSSRERLRAHVTPAAPAYTARRASAVVAG